LRADRFLKYIVRAALPDPAYEVERADEHDSPLAITAAMLSSIVNAHICVADITGRNPNVFYELALAHAMDKQVVIMDGEKERSPFDIQDQRAIKYGLMPDEIEAAVAQLRAKAANINSAPAFKDMMNPVATAFRAWTTQQRVESSGDSAEQALLRVVERLEEKVDRVERSFEMDDRSVVIDLASQGRDLVSQGRETLGEIQFHSTRGALDESLSGLLSEGAQAIWKADNSGSFVELHRWQGDAGFVLDRMRIGEPVNKVDLRANRPRIIPGRAS
jgi:hypothetical protein